MALSLSELLAAIEMREKMNSVTDRIQNGHNQASGALGSIFGSLYGMGGIKNGMTGMAGNMGAGGTTATGGSQMLR